MFSMIFANPTIIAWYDQIPGLNFVMDALENMLDFNGLIDSAASYAKALTFTEQLIWGVVLVLVLISGMIGLVKVVSKLAILAAIIFAIWLLFQNNVF